MSRRGKRSQVALTRRKIRYTLKTKLLDDSWRDIRLGETVCLTTRQDLYQHGVTIFGEEFIRIEAEMKVPFFEACDRGTILSDGYGRGALQ